MSRDSKSRVSNARSEPHVCAVIVHHRGLEMLDDCLRSLLSSIRIELSIVIVSNGCQEPLPALVDRDPRIHVTKPPTPVGFSEANNLGAKWATTNLPPAEAFYFVNNDTESRPDTLAVLLESMRREFAAVAGPLTLIHAAPDHINSVGIRITDDAGAWDDGIGLSFEQYGALPGVREVAAVTGSALLIDAEALSEMGGWSEVYEWYYEDIDLCLRAWKNGHRVIHVPESVILHRISATMSEGSERKVFYFRRNRLLIGLLHWPLKQLGRLLKRAIVDEILRAPRAHSVMQRRALRDIVRHLPRYLALRWRQRGDNTWARFLEPIGSVPVIELPQLTTADTDPETDATAQNSAGQPDTSSTAIIPSFWQPARDLATETDGGRRLLVLGWGPLPIEEARMHFAPGGRTWQFARALAADGHRVCVVCARMPGAYLDSEDIDSEDIDVEDIDVEDIDVEGQNLEGTTNGVPRQSGQLEPRHIETQDLPGLVAFAVERASLDDANLQALIEAFQPDALVGATLVASERAISAAGSLPVWVDLFGDPMAESQAKSMVHEGDGTSAYLRLMNPVLDRGDAFSAVSDRQKWAVVGQLGLAGRLTGATGGHQLVHTVPCAALRDEAASPKPVSPAGANKAQMPLENVEGLGDLADDALLMLWSGSFNTWCDVETLFTGVEKAMATQDRLYFLATGGKVAGHDESTYSRLLELVAGSEHQDRWRLLGGLPRDTFAALRDRVDFGLVTERPIYERSLGSSARILDWLSHGRPVVCTTLSEIGEAVAQQGLGLTYRVGDVDDLCRCLVDLCLMSRQELQTLGHQAREYAQRTFSIAATTEALSTWAADPTRAPDGDLERPNYLQAAAREAIAELDEAIEGRHAAEARWHEAESRFQELRSEIGRIHQSRMWKSWMLLYDFRSFLKSPFQRRRKTADS